MNNTTANKNVSVKDFLVDHPSILECPISPTPQQESANSWDNFGHITLDKPATTDLTLPHNKSVCNDSIDFNIMPNSQNIMSTPGDVNFPLTPILKSGNSILIVDPINTSPDVTECIEETSLAADSLSDTSANSVRDITKLHGYPRSNVKTRLEQSNLFLASGRFPLQNAI